MAVEVCKLVAVDNTVVGIVSMSGGTVSDNFCVSTVIYLFLTTLQLVLVASGSTSYHLAVLSQMRVDP